MITFYGDGVEFTTSVTDVPNGEGFVSPTGERLWLSPPQESK